MCLELKRSERRGVFGKGLIDMDERICRLIQSTRLVAVDETAKTILVDAVMREVPHETHRTQAIRLEALKWKEWV